VLLSKLNTYIHTTIKAKCLLYHSSYPSNVQAVKCLGQFYITVQTVQQLSDFSTTRPISAMSCLASSASPLRQRGREKNVSWRDRFLLTTQPLNLWCRQIVTFITMPMTWWPPLTGKRLQCNFKAACLIITALSNYYGTVFNSRCRLAWLSIMNDTKSLNCIKRMDQLTSTLCAAVKSYTWSVVCTDVIELSTKARCHVGGVLNDE